MVQVGLQTTIVPPSSTNHAKVHWFDNPNCDPGTAPKFDKTYRAFDGGGANTDPYGRAWQHCDIWYDGATEEDPTEEDADGYCCGLHAWQKPVAGGLWTYKEWPADGGENPTIKCDIIASDYCN